jgi:hypothetical protein
MTMKRNLRLIFCGFVFLAAAVQGKGQQFAQNGEPVITSTPNQPRFYGYPENNIVMLRWTAGNERSVDRYVVERSADSIHFDPLHEVVGRGAIDADGDSSYQDADSYPQTSPYYYRIRTVFLDGNSIVSPVIRVDVDYRRTPVLKPTVLYRGGTLRMDDTHDQPVTVNFFNTAGALVGSYLVNGNTFDINTTTFGKGMLIYRVSDEHHALINAGKIMIQ